MSASDSSPDRRKIKRKYLAFFTRVFDRSNGELLGHLANVTAEGAMVICERPLQTGKDYQLCMDLPETFFEKSYLAFEARCIWCKPDLAPQFHNAGFKFRRIAPEDIQIIERIIEAYGFRD